MATNEKELWKLISTFMANVNEKLEALSQNIKVIQQHQQRLEARINFIDEEIDRIQKTGSSRGMGVDRSQLQDVLSKIAYKFENQEQFVENRLKELDSKLNSTTDLVKNQLTNLKYALDNLNMQPPSRLEPESDPSSPSTISPSPSSSSTSPSSPDSDEIKLNPPTIQEKFKEESEEIGEATDEEQKLKAALKMFKDL
ncbi:MAG: hypothetical protein ACFFBD_09720 [Candidatus Hodarchaeota archaeon]